MIDTVYHLHMGLRHLKEQRGREEFALSEQALALIDHIGQILAEEYVKLLKENSEENLKEEE